MEFEPLRSVTPAIDIYIKLAQYPVLADEIRLRMRQELFRRGIISQADFENEIKQLAIESQRLEGLLEPYTQEETDIWELRKSRIREYHTDAYFANNLGIALLEQLISEVLRRDLHEPEPYDLKFNPEIAPWEMLFRQGDIYEAMPKPERKSVSHHLEEIKVVLIKRMISDQLPVIGVAKNVLSISDLRHVYQKRIGGGKIGGKAAGIVLAWKILQQKDPEFGPDISPQINIPDSYFIGSEVVYEFNHQNRLARYMNQKYRPIDEIRAEYPQIIQNYLQGQLPESIIDRLREVLFNFGNSPIIVRSSSLLEDNFGYSFAGKYTSVFCANQGNEEENLQDLMLAIKRVYASLSSPDALLYRKKNNLIDYDERMSIIVQAVQGHHYQQYFLPAVAGVAFSKNPFRWSPKIRREDGFLRIVWGLGTRAVNRVANDYPRLVALSHPQLRPDTTVQAERQYSQWLVDVIDLKSNSFETKPVDEILKADYPDLPTIASVDKGDYLQEIFAPGMLADKDEYVLTFNKLIGDQRFIKIMRTALQRLEQAYGRPVDVEFAIEVFQERGLSNYRLHVLQCRPMSQRFQNFEVTMPENVADNNIMFSSNWLVPDGQIENIRYIIYIDPTIYRSINEKFLKQEFGRVVSRLNQKLADDRFILMGPGRWGSVNIDLGIHVTYADIYHTLALVEIAFTRGHNSPELSHGTHFFHDLVETGIASLAIWPDGEHGTLNQSALLDFPNSLPELLPDDANFEPYLRVIDLSSIFPDRLLHIAMDGTKEKALGYLGKAQELP